MHKCNLIYAKKRCGLPCTHFRESDANRHSTAHAQIANTEFHPNKTIHVKSTEKVTNAPRVKCGFHYTDFLENRKCLKALCEDFYKEFLKDQSYSCTEL